MIDKRVATAAAAVADIADGATVMVAGFGGAGRPEALIAALCEQGARHLTLVANNAGGDPGLDRMLELGRIDKVICSFARFPVFDRLYAEGRVALELVPQGTLSERIRAAGAGIDGFYTRVSVGTPLAEGKDSREIDGVVCVLERPIHGDVALVKAARADRWGNLAYNRVARNFNPVMATAARLTICQAADIVELGDIDPDAVVTPGIYVDRVVCA